MPLVLAFLARLTGLGDIGKPIQALLQRLRRPLEAALEKLVGIILWLGQKLLAGPAKADSPNLAKAADTRAVTMGAAEARTGSEKETAVRTTVFCTRRTPGALISPL